MNSLSIKTVIKNFFKRIFRIIFHRIFLKIYGKIEKYIESNSDSRIKLEIINIENDLRYKVYKIKNGRLYTDRIHDTAAIIDNSIIEGPSFQLRYTHDSKIINSKITDNVV